MNSSNIKMLNQKGTFTDFVSQGPKLSKVSSLKGRVIEEQINSLFSSDRLEGTDLDDNSPFYINKLIGQDIVKESEAEDKLDTAQVHQFELFIEKLQNKFARSCFDSLIHRFQELKKEEEALEKYRESTEYKETILKHKLGILNKDLNFQIFTSTNQILTVNPSIKIVKKAAASTMVNDFRGKNSKYIYLFTIDFKIPTLNIWINDHEIKRITRLPNPRTLNLPKLKKLIVRGSENSQSAFTTKIFHSLMRTNRMSFLDQNAMEEVEEQDEIVENYEVINLLKSIFCTNAVLLNTSVGLKLVKRSHDLDNHLRLNNFLDAEYFSLTDNRISCLQLQKGWPEIKDDGWLLQNKAVIRRNMNRKLFKKFMAYSIDSKDSSHGEQSIRESNQLTISRKKIQRNTKKRRMVNVRKYYPLLKVKQNETYIAKLSDIDQFNQLILIHLNQRFHTKIFKIQNFFWRCELILEAQGSSNMLSDLDANWLNGLEQFNLKYLITRPDGSSSSQGRVNLADLQYSTLNLSKEKMRRLLFERILHHTNTTRCLIKFDEFMQEIMDSVLKVNSKKYDEAKKIQNQMSNFNKGKLQRISHHLNTKIEADTGGDLYYSNDAYEDQEFQDISLYWTNYQSKDSYQNPILYRLLVHKKAGELDHKRKVAQISTFW